MADVFKTPGVYVQEISKFPPSVAQVETAIPAFIGYTEKAELPDGTFLGDTPLRITSELEYSTFFGGAPEQTGIVVQLDLKETAPTPIKAHIGTIGADAGGNPVINAGTPSAYRMAHAVRMYYANGGGPCYIVSVGSYADAINVDAMGTGNAGDPAAAPPVPPVLGGLTAIRKIDEVTLLLFPDADGLGATNYYDLYEKALTQCAELQDRFTIIDVKQAFARDLANGIATAIDAMRNELTSDFLNYGAAYWPYLNTTLTYRHNQDTSVTIFKPGDADYHAKTLKDLKDADASATPPDPNTPAKKLVTNKFLADVNNIINQLPVIMPPSSAIAGIYARTDSTRGVWKAPANTGVTLVREPAVKINFEDQMDMNVHTTGKSVNAIRSFIGKGTLVWGARTLDGNSNEWRYVPVRRLFIMVEESVKKATERFVFEPNDANTWSKVRAMIENFLTLQWRSGALAGPTPESAFYVRVGLNETMTALDILEGRMIVEIGMAAVRPAEFIILRFSHKMQEA